MSSQSKSNHVRSIVLIAIGTLFVLTSLVWFGLKYLSQATPNKDTDQASITENSEDIYETDSNNKETAEQTGDTATDEASLNDN